MLNFVLTKVSEYAWIVLLFLGLTGALQGLLVMWEKARRRPVSWFEPSFLFLSSFIAFSVVFFAVRVGLLSPRNVPAQDIVWFNTTRTWPKFLGKLAFHIPLGAIMIFNTWTTAPTFMPCTLQVCRISQELYEAARWTGRSAGMCCGTLSALKPITFLIVTMGLIGTLQMFDQVAILAGRHLLNQ